MCFVFFLSLLFYVNTAFYPVCDARRCSEVSDSSPNAVRELTARLGKYCTDTYTSFFVRDTNDGGQVEVLVRLFIVLIGFYHVYFIYSFVFKGIRLLQIPQVSNPILNYKVKNRIKDPTLLNMRARTLFVPKCEATNQVSHPYIVGAGN